MIQGDIIESKQLDEFRVKLVRTENITTVATLLEVFFFFLITLEPRVELCNNL